MAQTFVKTSIAIPEETFKRLEKMMREDRRSRSNLLSVLVEKEYEARERNARILRKIASDSKAVAA